MSKRTGLGTFIVGYAAGVVTGVLVAPKSGKETREDLKRYATNISNDVAQKTENLVHNDKIESAVNKTKEQFVKIKDASNNRLSSIKDYANNKFANSNDNGFTKLELEEDKNDISSSLESEIDSIINSTKIELPNSDDEELKRIIENINRR